MTKEETLATIRANGSSWVTYIYDELHEDVMGQYREMKNCTMADRATIKAIRKIAENSASSHKQGLDVILALCEEE